jgi:hypothetical protein
VESPSCNFIFVEGCSFLAPCVLGLHLFSSEVFIFEPLAFWVVSFFYWRSLFLSLLCFGVASFFIGGLYFLAPCVLELPFYSSDVFFLATCILGLPLLSSEVFIFEPTSEGSNSEPLVVTLAY